MPLRRKGPEIARSGPTVATVWHCLDLPPLIEVGRVDCGKVVFAFPPGNNTMESKRLAQVWQLAFFFGSSFSRETQANSSSFSHVIRRDYFATLTASNSISINHWIGHPERNFIFQSLIFRGYVKFRDGRRLIRFCFNYINSIIMVLWWLWLLSAWTLTCISICFEIDDPNDLEVCRTSVGIYEFIKYKYIYIHMYRSKYSTEQKLRCRVICIMSTRKVHSLSKWSGLIIRLGVDYLH